MRQVAWAITEIFSPTVMVTLFLVITSVAVAGWRGFWAGLLAALFTALGPFTGILLATRRGMVTDHHVGNRRQRLPIVAASLASAAAGFAVLLIFNAPWISVAGLIGVSLGMIVVGAVNAFWKLSVHNAVVMFVIVGCSVVLGPGWLVLLILPVIVGWSRVRLEDHTLAQVIAGAFAGTLVGLVYAALI